MNAISDASKEKIYVDSCIMGENYQKKIYLRQKKQKERTWNKAVQVRILSLVHFTMAVFPSMR